MGSQCISLTDKDSPVLRIACGIIEWIQFWTLPHFWGEMNTIFTTLPVIWLILCKVEGKLCVIRQVRKSGEMNYT